MRPLQRRRSVDFCPKNGGHWTSCRQRLFEDGNRRSSLNLFVLGPFSPQQRETFPCHQSIRSFRCIKTKYSVKAVGGGFVGTTGCRNTSMYIMQSREQNVNPSFGWPRTRLLQHLRSGQGRRSANWRWWERHRRRRQQSQLSPPNKTGS